MHVSLRTALVLLATTAVAAGACGGNVVVDTPTGSTGIANGGAGPTTGTEPETTDTSVTGFGSTTGTGFGGSNTTGTGFGASDTGTGFGGSNTTTGTGFGSTSVSSSSGGPSGACTNPSDLMFLDGKVLYPAIVLCAEQFLGSPGPTTMCIESQTGLTSPCAACVVSDLQCSIQTCLAQCQSQPNSADCETCRNDHCAAPFLACSGLGDGPGSTTCADALTQGTKGMGWPGSMPAEAFVTEGGWESYQLVDECACDPGGACTGLCSGNFCGIATASAACLACLETSCAGATTKCDQN